MLFYFKCDNIEQLRRFYILFVGLGQYFRRFRFLSWSWLKILIYPSLQGILNILARVLVWLVTSGFPFVQPWLALLIEYKYSPQLIRNEAHSHQQPLTAHDKERRARIRVQASKRRIGHRNQEHQGHHQVQVAWEHKWSLAGAWRQGDDKQGLLTQLKSISLLMQFVDSVIWIDNLCTVTSNKREIQCDLYLFQPFQFV